MLDIESALSTEVQINGPWKHVDCHKKDCVGHKALHDNDAHKGDMWAKFNPTLPEAGLYTVAIAYSTSRTRATNVPVTISSAYGSATVTADQKNVEPDVDGFVSLGVFPLAATGSMVLISNAGTNGKVVIDAVRFSCASVSPTPSPTTSPTSSPTEPTYCTKGSKIVLDSQSATSQEFNLIGDWKAVSCDERTCHEDNFLHDKDGGKGWKSGTFTFTVPEDGHYTVSIAYTTSRTRATNVPVTVMDSSLGSHTVMVDQKNVEPNADGFRAIGEFALSTAGSTITISNEGTNGKVILDAVRIECASFREEEEEETTAAPREEEFANLCLSQDVLVLDTQSASPSEVVVTGDWKSVTCTSRTCNEDGFLHDKDSGKGSKQVEFFPTFARAGTYAVSIAYTTSRTRATNVPVTIEGFGPASTVLVDQKNTEPNADGFVLLGNFDFAATGGRVLISNSGTDGKVIVDAVRFSCQADDATPIANDEPAQPDSPDSAGSDDELEPCTAGASVVVDAEVLSSAVVIVGDWKTRTCTTSDCISQNAHFMHDGANGKGSKSVLFKVDLPGSGSFRVDVAYTSSRLRATNVPVTVSEGERILGQFFVDQTQEPNADGYITLGTFAATSGQLRVLIETFDTEEKVVVDAVRVVCAAGSDATDSVSTPTGSNTANANEQGGSDVDTVNSSPASGGSSLAVVATVGGLVAVAAVVAGVAVQKKRRSSKAGAAAAAKALAGNMEWDDDLDGTSAMAPVADVESGSELTWDDDDGLSLSPSAAHAGFDDLGGELDADTLAEVAETYTDAPTSPAVLVANISHLDEADDSVSTLSLAPTGERTTDVV